MELIFKPQDLMVGDWVLHHGAPHLVVGIDYLALKTWQSANRCALSKFVGYDEVKPIPISPDYLKLFGFRQADGESDWLEGNVWKITFDDKDVEDHEACEFMFSWTEDEYRLRSYKTIFRGYGDTPCFRFDAISDIQHFFYQESRCPMPLSCHPQPMPVSDEARRFLDGLKKKQLYNSMKFVNNND